MNLKNEFPTPIHLFFLVMSVYLLTICPTVYLGDSGELSAAGYCLGIAHNSGYPLYGLIGKIFCMIPFGHIGFRMNLMSAFFAGMTVWLVYSMIYNLGISKLGACVGALLLGFTPLLWSQGMSAEVYTLHGFFVVLLMRVLWWWDERKEFSRLLVFVFVAGISFGNHMQTVMLAPAVLLFIFQGDRGVFFDIRRFFLISGVFGIALFIYLYLPIRTVAGAAIHWGDPDTLERFWAHVSGRSHRSGYVLTKTWLEYWIRTKEVVWFIWSQFGVMLLPAFWGWLKLGSMRWRKFFVLVIVFDFTYTIFLNIISIEITAFQLSTGIVLSILTGIGIADVVKRSEGYGRIGIGIRRMIKAGCYVMPGIPLLLNFGYCDQSLNYIAYEHAQNIFRTVDEKGILFLEGDNHFFPVTYGRLVERMREDVALFDRQDILFKMRYMGPPIENAFYGEWEEIRLLVEQSILGKAGAQTVLYAVFNPHDLSMPSESILVPFCLLSKIVKREEFHQSHYVINDLWRYYVSESIYDQFQKDYLNRQVCAFFHLKKAEYCFLTGNRDLGLKYAQESSRIAYNETGLHSSLAIVLMDQGLFEAAKKMLEKANSLNESPEVLQTNWGWYYYRIGAYNLAVEAYLNAIQIKPQNPIYYKNLGHALYKEGSRKEAIDAFQRSLSLNPKQADVIEFIKKNDL